MKQHKKKAAEIPQAIYTNQFLRFVAVYVAKFRATERWIAEYERMDEKNMFEPKTLRELYIKILDGTNTLSYIYWDAVNYICVQALDATEAFISANTYEIRVITGEIAVDDDDKELINLALEEAMDICAVMNEEAEENLFVVYNSSTNKII